MKTLSNKFSLILFLSMIFIIVFAVSFISADTGPGYTTCGELNITGTTYTLANDVASNSTCFNMSAGNITLDCAGYTISYGDNVPGYGIKNVVNSHNLTIKNCNITKGNRTVFTITHDNNYGIWIDDAANTTIYNNNISTYGSDNNYGIYLQGTSADSNVTKNTIYPYGYGSSQYGVYIYEDADRTIIEENTVYANNSLTGAIYSIGIYTREVNDCTVFNNFINTDGKDSDNVGIYITSSNYLKVDNNLIKTSGTSGDYGIHMQASSVGMNITNNFINSSGSSSNQGGINYEAVTLNNLIFNNTIYTGSTVLGDINRGILIRGGNHNISKNFIHTSGRNSNYGIHLYATENSSVTDNLIKTINGTTAGNDNYGIYLHTSTINNTIKRNNISTWNNARNYGIILDTTVKRNTISENLVNADGIAYNTGLYMVTNVDENLIENNTFISKGKYNLHNMYGASLYASSNNTIRDNNFTVITPSSVGGTTNDHCFYLVGPSQNNTIQNNTINNITGSVAYLVVYSGTYPHNNYISNNSVIGLIDRYYLEIGTASINGTILEDQYIKNYTFTGVGGTLTIKNSQFGQIQFLNPINGTGTNLSDDIQFGNNSVTINSNSNIGLNRSANVTIYNLRTNFTAPIILKDGIPCGTKCYNFTSLNAGIVVFNVSSWSNYSIGEDTFAPNVTLNTPANLSIVNKSVDNVTLTNFTANVSDVGAGVKNATLFIYNQDELYNETVMEFSTGVLSRIVGIPVLLVEGFYTWFYKVFDWAGTSGTSDATSGNFTYNLTYTGPGYTECGELNVTNNIYTLTQNVSSTTTCFNITADNITLNGNGYTINFSSGGTMGYGVYANAVTNFTLKNTFVVIGSYASISDRYGVFMSSANYTTIFNNTLSSAGGYYGDDPLSFRGTCNDNLVENNSVYYPSGVGIYFHGGGSRNTIINNTVWGFGGGAISDYSGISYSTIKKNFVNDSRTDGNGIQTAGTYDNITDNIVIVSGSTGHGIRVGVCATSITNVVNNSVTVTNNGISAQCSKINIQDNVITATNGWGINMSLVNPTSSITGNRVNTSNSYSFYLYNANKDYYNHTIDSTNIVEGKPLNYTYDAENLVFNNVDFTQYGAVIFAYSRNITIRNSAFSGDSLSFFLVNNSVVENNNFNTSKGHGIFLYSSSYNNFTNNTINTSCINCNGIDVSTSSNNNIFQSNNITTYGSQADGFYFDSSSESNFINKSDIFTTGQYGRGVMFSSGNNNVLTNSKITTLSSTNAVDVGSVTNITVSYNFLNCTGTSYPYTIVLYGSGHNINFNVIKNSGLYFGYGIYISASNSRFVQNNITTDGSDKAYGIYLDNSANDNIFYLNNITTSRLLGHGVYLNNINNNSFSRMNIYTGDSSANAFFIAGSPNFTINDSVLDSNITISDLNITSSATSGQWNFTNVTRANGAKLNISWVTGGVGTLNMHWYINAYANYTNSSIDGGANISAWNNNSVLLFSNITTSADGTIATQTALEYKRSGTSGTTKTYYSNYTFNATRSNGMEVILLSSNISTNRNLFFTFDLISPNASLNNPLNNTYTNNGTSINFTANLTDNSAGLKNATFYLYNQSSLYNETTITSYAVGTLSSSLGIVVSVLDGVYNWFYKMFDWAGNSFETNNNTITIDTTIPIPSFVEPTPSNNSGKAGVVEINVSITETNLANISFAFTNQPNIICNRTSISLRNTFSCNNENATLFNITSTNYIFLFNKTGLTAGTRYYYNLTAYDFSGNSNVSETRLVKGNTPPEFITITHTPSEVSTLDPGTIINISVSVNDTEYNLDSLVFQWRNDSSTWGAGTAGSVNITMSNSSTFLSLSNSLASTSFNASLTTPTYEGAIYYRIWANDTIGDAENSTIYLINNSWDCTWIYSTTISSTAGWDINKEIGNITINNTGDSQYSASCQLQFKLTHELTASNPSNSRMAFDDKWWKPSDTYTLAAKHNVTIKVNASFLTEVKSETPKISIDEISSRTNDSEENITATLVTNQNGPYLYQSLSSYPTTVSLKLGNSFSLEGYVRNLMGDDTFNDNNTAYNVSFNWTLPTAMTNNSGILNLFFTNISNSSIIYNNLNVTFSDLASAPSGSQTIYLYSQGYNLTGDKIKDATNLTLLTNSVSINFECYNISDGVVVSSCGSLDGDYVAQTTTVTTTTSSGAGGGGGSPSNKEIVKSSADFQLVRGLENEIKLIYKNNAQNDSLKDLKLSFNSDIGKYLDIYPTTISNLAPGEEITITIKINSPTYIDLGQHKINLLIDGKKAGLQYSETKVLTVEIHQISSAQADELVNATMDLLKKLEDANLTSEYIQKLLAESLAGMQTFDYEKLIKNNKEIEKQVTYAIDSLDIIAQLDELVKLSEEKGISVSASKRMIKLARLSLERSEFELAYSRAKDAQITYALEIKGELGKLSFYLKAYPKEILAGLIFLSLFSFGTYRITRLQKIKNKIKKLEEEEEILKDLIKVVQRECFEEKKMSMEEYQTTVNQYQKKLSHVVENLIELENKRVHALKFTSPTKQMNIERENVIDLIKDLQRDYMTNGKIDERVYRTKLESYTKRVSDIDEKMAELESKQAFKKNNGFIVKLKRLFGK